LGGAAAPTASLALGGRLATDVTPAGLVRSRVEIPDLIRHAEFPAGTGIGYLTRTEYFSDWRRKAQTQAWNRPRIPQFYTKVGDANAPGHPTEPHYFALDVTRPATPFLFADQPRHQVESNTGTKHGK
jgi:hypothetical protein